MLASHMTKIKKYIFFFGISTSHGLFPTNYGLKGKKIWQGVTYISGAKNLLGDKNLWVHQSGSQTQQK